MPTGGHKPPPLISKQKLKSSGGSHESQQTVNLTLAKGEITSPRGSNQKHIPSSQSPTTRLSGSLPVAPEVSSDITKHPLYNAVRSLQPDLKPFLQHDWKTNRTYNLTKLKYYSILHHFDPNTTARPTQKKDLLNDRFENGLRPRLLPFCVPPPPPDDSMDHDSREDFDPLGRRTTIAMLSRAIHKINPSVNISSVALKDEVLVLYKHYVDNSLQLPATSFKKRPRLVQSKYVSKLSIQILRHSIQSYHPELFLNVAVLRLANYISIYRLFLLDKPQPDEDPLLEGYHYWIIEDLVNEDA